MSLNIRPLNAPPATTGRTSPSIVPLLLSTSPATSMHKIMERDAKLYRVPFPSDAIDYTEAPAWQASAVQKKKAKHYATSGSLNPLINANFDAPGLRYPDAATALAKYAGDFASIWIVTNLRICSVFTPPGMGSVPGWGKVRDPSKYYP